MSLRLPDSGAPVAQDGRRTAPSAQRNLSAILAVLARHAPASGQALELASGTGQQIVAFAAAHPHLDWQATDGDPDNLASIAAWALACPGPNLRPPRVMDVGLPGWGKDHAGLALIFAANLLHLVPQPVAQVAIAEAAAALAPAGRLMIYGPFLRQGRATSDGDARFDASLRAQDASLGYKDLDWVVSQMETAGLRVLVEDMPANNLTLIAFKD